ncbi:MAG: Mitochondrial distribution and morphology protein 12 [Candelina submexicana]|nr:MAG: Mitochondrial distribution and morphology protein 12 [Candelina submexicana]
MSIDIDWDTLTNGPDGLALAETIRAFVHDKFQEVELPRFIRAVQVHSFDFGAVGPDIALKDICDPLPDFYEGGHESASEDGDDHDISAPTAEDKAYDWTTRSLGERRRLTNLTKNDAAPNASRALPPPYMDMRLPGLRPTLGRADPLESPLFPRTNTPGIPGGTSNMNYFHLPLVTSLSGAQTPLAAVAGAQYFNGWQDHNAMARDGPQANAQDHRDIAQMGSPSPPSTANAAFSQALSPDSGNSKQGRAPISRATQETPASLPPLKVRERHADDFQVVLHVRYAGDVKLSLTAEILLDYPMPSFVSIPLKLNITGLTFDGVAVIAYIRKHAHFCFLCPEDAEVLVGAEQGSNVASLSTTNRKIGGPLQEIKVESEIGQKDNGRQVLKNVGKVEKFVLEQVRRIFEDEFVYPSFWTFFV